MTDLISLTSKLIELPTSPDNAKALSEALSLVLAELSDFTIERFNDHGVESALVYHGPTRPKTFGVIINAHLDIIPGKADQLKPVLEGDKLYGLGALDMKAGVACLVKVFHELAPSLPYPIALQLTTDEEIGGFHGTKYQIAQGVKANFVLTSEPTNLEIVTKAKGILQLKVTAPGRTAHGAYPWKGDNPIWNMTKFLTALRSEFPDPAAEVWATTINAGNIETTNHSFNKVPDSCTVWLDIRYIPSDQAHIKSRIESLMPKGFSSEVIVFEDPLNTADSDPFVQTLSSVTEKLTGQPTKIRGANGTSDSRFFGAYATPAIEFGPTGEGMGSDSEWVSVKSLSTYCDCLKSFLQKAPVVDFAPSKP